MNKYIYVLLPFVFLYFFSCASQLPVKDEDLELSCPPPEEELPVEYLTIIAGGDNIIHDYILRASDRDGSYCFDSIYDLIKEYILPADIAFINQETVLGNEALGFSGYPLFSTPYEAGTALAFAGFNLINHATNHVMDKGEEGILSTIDYWDSTIFVRADNTWVKIQYLGIHRSEEERQNRKIIFEKNNIKIGFLGYTYGTNNIPLPDDKQYLVSLANPMEMAAEINALRPLVDYLVISMHWGDEYGEDINPYQEKFAAFFADHSVDLVIGHHTHILGPVETKSRPDGGTTVLFYSLGNFLSAHVRPIKEALLGGLLYVKVKKTGDIIEAEEIGLIPTVTHYETNLTGFKVYPLSDYSEELAGKHWRRLNDREMTYDYLIKKARDRLGSRLILDNPFFR